MPIRPIINAIIGRLPFYGRPGCASSRGGRRLLAAAALLHVALALALFCAGRAQVAPGLIDRDGIMGSFAFDSYEYQRGAVRLAGILKGEGLRAWAAEPAPLHVKLISVEFALLGPLFGYGVLSAEPLNLLAYLAVVALALALGREVGGPRVGLLSAGAVALWPTFLLHSLQLLKDTLFIAGALALLLCVTTWLTRTYDRRRAARALALTAAAAALLLLVRLNTGLGVLALVLLGLTLLVVRQLREGRLLYWNMACPLVLLLAAGALMPFYASRPRLKFKPYPSDQGGQPKAAASAGVQIPTITTYRPHASASKSASLPLVGPLFEAADGAARRVSNARSRFAASYTEAGSGIDPRVEFVDFADLVLYLPRAFEIGFWAPFPNTWAAAGRRVGSAGRLLAGAEMLVIYACQLLALAAVLLLRGPRRLASWLLLSVATFGAVALGLVVPNVGALYRFRYPLWVLLIILGVTGFERVRRSFRRRRRGLNVRAATAAVLLACLLATACSRPAGAGATGGRRLALDNSTGASFRALYLSPSDSTGWEEDVLGGEGLPPGETLEIQFGPGERAAFWDLRVEAVDGHYAEWKRLSLQEASGVRLRLSLAGEPAAVAEVE